MENIRRPFCQAGEPYFTCETAPATICLVPNQQAVEILRAEQLQFALESCSQLTIAEQAFS